MAKIYEVYKDSESNWVGLIPSQWSIGKFRYYGEFTKGKLPATSNAEHIGLPIIGASEMLGKEYRFFTEESNIPICEYNDILILWDGANAGIISSHHVGIVSSTAVKYHCNNSDVEKNYLFYYFKSAESFFQAKVTGTTIPHMNIKFINEIPLLIPSYEEQQAIASFLDKKCGEIDSLLALQEEMIVELQAYKQSVITEAVTKGLDHNVKMKDSDVEWIGEIPEAWNIRILLKIIWLRARLGWKGLKAEEYVEFGYPFLSAFNIINNQLNWSDLNYINKQRYDESPEIKLSIGDILIVKDGAGIGKIARVDSLPYGESTVNSSLGVITPSEELAYQFLYYYLLSNPFQNMVGFLKNGMGVPHLTQENMKSALIPIPPLSEQRAIAAYLDTKTSQIDSLIAIKQEKIAELKDYKKSIIYEYVTGKKKV